MMSNYQLQSRSYTEEKVNEFDHSKEVAFATIADNQEFTDLIISLLGNDISKCMEILEGHQPIFSSMHEHVIDNGTLSVDKNTACPRSNFVFLHLSLYV